MASASIPPVETDKLIIIHNKFETWCRLRRVEECPVVKGGTCVYSGECTRVYGQIWRGVWMGRPGRRPKRKEDQVLEITKGRWTQSLACRDYSRPFVYGWLRETNPVDAAKRIIDMEIEGLNNSEMMTTIISWFVDRVERLHPITPPMHIYIGDILRKEMGETNWEVRMNGILKRAIKSYNELICKGDKNNGRVSSTGKAEGHTEGEE